MRLRVPLVLAAALAASLVPPTPDVAARPKTIRFEAPTGGSLLVHGEYPRRDSSCVDPQQPLLHARFRGAIEVTKAEGGSLYVIGELAFEDYLKGIAEVPRSWPMEALKAQVVAARTYAMTRLRRGSSEGRALGYDLCATTACQVYLGMGIEAGAWGRRWVRAVEATAGEVLIHQGRTADTLYSSTSNGRTYDNEDVFGGAPAPYLRGAVEPDDGASPLARWRVALPLADLRRFLAANGLWGAEPITSVTSRKGRVVIRGGGERLRLDKEALRDALNDVASCLDGGYPTREPDGYRLPQTVPSRWYRARQDGGSLVLEGRGWGHGVGMVQWGAYGKAKRGLGYGDILAAYYGGLRPEEAPNPPGTIRVLIADDLERVTVVPDGTATVTGRPVVPEPWLVTGGRRLRLRTGAAPPPSLRIRVRGTAMTDDGARLVVSLSNDANLRLQGTTTDGSVRAGPWRPVEDGRRTVALSLDGVTGLEAPPVLVADDGVDRVTVTLGARGGPRPTPSSPGTTGAPPSPTADAAPGTEPAGRRGPPAWAVAIPVAVLALFALLLLRRRRTGLHRG